MILKIAEETLVIVVNMVVTIPFVSVAIMLGGMLSMIWLKEQVSLILSLVHLET